MKTVYNSAARSWRFLFLIFALQFLTPGFATAQDAFYIYRNDGDFNGFFFDEVIRMGYSKIGPDSVEYDAYVVQEIETEDSLYRIPLAAIDSIGFQQPEIRMSPHFKNMDELGITPYVTKKWGWTGMRLGVSKDIPAELRPQVGDVMAGFDIEKWDGGAWVGKIKAESAPLSWLDEDDGSYYYEVEDVTELSDVFDQFITVEDIGVDPSGNVQRRIAGCNPDGTIRRAGENSNEVTILDLSGIISREWKPDKNSSIALSADVGVKFKIRATYNIGWTRLFVKLTRDLIIQAAPSISMSISRGFDENLNNFLPNIIIPRIVFPATCPIFETSPFPQWFIRGEGKIEAKLNMPSVELGIGEDVIIDTNDFFPVGYYLHLVPSEKGQGGKDPIDLGSAEVSFSGYLQTGIKFTGNLATASWFSKIFQGEIGLYLYCGPKIDGNFTFKKNFADEGEMADILTSLRSSELHRTYLSLDLEAKATAAVGWKDPEEKKFFDKNWSFFSDTLRFIPTVEDLKVVPDKSGNMAEISFTCKGVVLGNSTFKVNIYDEEDKLVKTVGNWIYVPQEYGRPNYYSTKFPTDDLKAGPKYHAKLMLTWSGAGPFPVAYEDFVVPSWLQVPTSELTFGAVDNLEQHVQFTTNADISHIYYEPRLNAHNDIHMEIRTLDRNRNLYDAVITVTPNTGFFEREIPANSEFPVRIGTDMYYDEKSDSYKCKQEHRIGIKQEPHIVGRKASIEKRLHIKWSDGGISDYWDHYGNEKDEKLSKNPLPLTITPQGKDKVIVTASSSKSETYYTGQLDIEFTVTRGTSLLDVTDIWNYTSIIEEGNVSESHKYSTPKTAEHDASWELTRTNYSFSENVITSASGYWSASGGRSMNGSLYGGVNDNWFKIHFE